MLPNQVKKVNLVNGQIGQELQPNNQKWERAGNGCKNTIHLSGADTLVRVPSKFLAFCFQTPTSPYNNRSFLRPFFALFSRHRSDLLRFYRFSNKIAHFQLGYTDSTFILNSR